MHQQMEVLAHLLLATDWLLCTGPLAAAYVLKKEQMAGNGDIPPKMCDAQTVQHWRDPLVLVNFRTN